ncbi:MAG: alpha/beta hydrolase [Alphaproteobacteria bacterium]|nr:alpha/beta hydrolase [Alphaproteobacteria bacterium]
MNALLFIVFLIIYNLSFSDIVTLPNLTGPYGVGVSNIELLDTTRTQLRSDDKRYWMATVFYPTVKTNNVHPYMPGTLKDGVVCGTKVLGYAIPEVPILKNQKFPVIIALPGRGGERQKETILYETLTSNGYIIIAMDQPYVANFVKFSNGTKITLTLKDAWNVPRDRDYRYQYDDKVIEGALKDINFVLENFNCFGDLEEIFDKQKIILMGHSLGGNIAHIKGFSDKRIIAIIDIDSKITERAVFGRVGVFPNPDAKPVLFIRGMKQYQEDVGDQLTKIPNSTIWSPDVQHSAFSDDAYFAAKIPNYGMGFWKSVYNWLFKKGPYFDSIDTNLGEYSVDQWFYEYPKYIVNWLGKNLHAIR